MSTPALPVVQIRGTRPDLHDEERDAPRHCWYSDKLRKSLAEKSGLRPNSLHTFRKTGASILESLGVSRAEIQVALRQKRPSVTDTYVRVYMEERREHIEHMANLLFDTPSFPQSSLKAG